MFKVHGYLDNKRVMNGRMGHLPRVGETVRFAGDVYGIVTEVVWCMDESIQEGQRVNIRIESEIEAEPEPVQEPWDLAEKVRRDLDRQSCPGVYMDIAVESIVKHYSTPPAQHPLDGVIEVKPVGYHSLQLIFDSQTSISNFIVTHGITAAPTQGETK